MAPGFVRESQHREGRFLHKGMTSSILRSRTDGTENLVGAIRTCTGVCGAQTIPEFHQAEIVVAPSIKTEGKVYQLRR